MYAQRGHGKRSSLLFRLHLRLLARGADGKRELAPVGKAYFGFTDEELRWLDKWVRDHTTNRFGPVREVEPELVLEIAFDGIARSTRHKSGVAMRFPRINRIRTDKPAAEADTVDNLLRLRAMTRAMAEHVPPAPCRRRPISSRSTNAPPAAVPCATSAAARAARPTGRLPPTAAIPSRS